MIIQRVASSCDDTRKYIQTALLKSTLSKWLVVTTDSINGISCIAHGQKVCLDDFDAIWIDEWPAIYSCEEFLYDLFSKDRLIIFSQKFEFSMASKFFKKWCISYHYILKESLLPCRFSPFLKVIKEYSYSFPNMVLSFQDFSKSSLSYLKLGNTNGPCAFYSKEASIWHSFSLWAGGRHRPREVIISFGEDKDRGNLNKKDALPGQTFNWRAFTALWENSLGSFLWGTGGR